MRFVRITPCLALALCSFVRLIVAGTAADVGRVSSVMPEQSAVLPVSDVLPDDGSGIALLDEALDAFAKAGKKAILRFEKKVGRKFTSEDSDGLSPEEEYLPVLTEAFKKAKGTGSELLMLYWITAKHVFSNEETYPAILRAWKKHPNRWEAILVYNEEILQNQSIRSGRAKQPADKRAILLWIISEERKVVTHMITIKPEVWLNIKTLAWWYQHEKRRRDGRPGAPTKPEDVLPSYAWAVHNLIYDELELVTEKLCTAADAKDVLAQLRTRCEDALKKEPGSKIAGDIRKALTKMLPKVEKELAEHPELWPKSLPKWDGRPSWEIKLEND